jgi:hypothetical protein
MLALSEAFREENRSVNYLRQLKCGTRLPNGKRNPAPGIIAGLEGHLARADQ